MAYIDDTPISPAKPEYNQNEVDPKVANYTRQVREKIKGVDVRESLARSADIISIVASVAKVTSEEAIEITQQLIDDNFDDGALATEIERKLNELETQYAPQLSTVKSELIDITLNVKSFGLVGDGITDDTQAWNEMVQMIPEGSRVLFPKATYLGNFISNKSLDVDFQNSLLLSSAPDLPNFKFEGSLSSPIAVTGNPSYGETTIFIADTSVLEVNDVVVIKDEAARPSDGKKDINQELLKIKSIDSVGNAIEFYDKIRGEFNTGNVTLTKVETIKSPTIKNVSSQNNDDHLGVNFHFYACEDVFVDIFETENSHGDALRFEYVYGYRTGDTRFKNPRSIGSGQGYGMAVNFSREGYSRFLKGLGTRHAVDFSSSYNCEVETVSELNGKGAAVILTHNGFGGNIKVDNVLYKGDDYAVVANSQGIAEENKNFQVMRGYNVKNIEHYFSSKKPDEYAITVMVQHDYAGILVEKVRMFFPDGDIVPSLNSSAVRLDGNQRGSVTIKDIKANVVGSLVRLDRRSELYTEPHITNISNLEAGKCVNAGYLRGVVNSKVSGMIIDDAIAGLLRFDQRFGVYCQYVTLDNGGIDVTLLKNTLIDPVSLVPEIGIQGKMPLFGSTVSAAYSVNNGQSVPIDKIIDSSALLRLQSPTGQASTTLSTNDPLAPPFWMNQRLIVGVNEIGNFTSARGDVIIPANTNTVAGNEPITLKTGKAYEFAGYNGKWHLIN